MDLRSYIAFVRRRWWLLILGPLLACAAAYVVSERMTPVYRSTTKLLVVNQAGGINVIQLNDILTNDRLVSTYVELVNRRPILESVVSKLQLPMTADQLRNKVSVSEITNTQLISISVEDNNAALSATIANTIATQFIDDNSRELGRPGTVSVAEEATTPSRPAKPNVKMNVLLAGMLGLIVAGGLGVGLEYLDDTVKTSEDLERLGLTSIGRVEKFRSKLKSGRGRRPVAAPATALEDYRDLRTNLHFVDLESSIKTLVVTSAGPGEGKSTTAANLARVLAQAGDKVILVDADLRLPSLHQIMGTPNSFGLTGLLLSDSDNPWNGLVATDIPELMVLPSGPLPPNPSELLTSKRMAKLIESLQGRADYVIFDTPPLSTVTDAGILAGSVDGVLLVVEVSRTRSSNLKQAMRSLLNVRARVVGAVMNKTAPLRGHYRYRAYVEATGDQTESGQGKVIVPNVRVSANGASEAAAEAAPKGAGSRLLFRR